MYLCHLFIHQLTTRLVDYPSIRKLHARRKQLLKITTAKQ